MSSLEADFVRFARFCCLYNVFARFLSDFVQRFTADLNRHTAQLIVEVWRA